MDTLLRKKASLDTYDVVMEWHLRATGKIQDHQQVKDVKQIYISRQKLIKKLAKRYNMDQNNLVRVKQIILPCSKTKVNIVYHEARDCVVSLLTDPRFKPQDYLFWARDPYGTLSYSITILAHHFGPRWTSARVLASLSSFAMHMALQKLKTCSSTAATLSVSNLIVSACRSICPAMSAIRS